MLVWQCARVSLQTLTLSRYILESSLLEYMFVSQCESLMAAACLLLAMCMNGDGVWVCLSASAIITFIFLHLVLFQLLAPSIVVYTFVSIN